MIYAGLLAGGYGWKKYLSEMPMQYMLLGKKPILIHSLEQFILNPSIDSVIVVAPNNWIVYTRDMIKNYIVSSKRIEVIRGGNNKYQSIIHIAEYIAKNHSISDDDICIFHDAIRPFVTQRIINSNLSMIEHCQAVSTVVSSIDTVICSNDGKIVHEIPDKSSLYLEQTPQTFRLKKLLEIYEEYAGEEQNEINAFRSFLKKKQEVRIAEGDYSNIKIITHFDFEMANALIKEHKRD